MSFTTRPHTPAETKAPDSASFVRRAARLRLLRIFVVLVFLLPVLFYEENWRGKSAWENYRHKLISRGVQLDWHSLAPPPVPDAENLATTPFLAALFDYVPGTYTPRDLRAYNRVAGFAQTDAPYAQALGRAERVPPMFRGQRTDLGEGLRLLRNMKEHPGQPAHGSEPAPPDRSAAATALLAELAQFQPVLAELRAASARPQARFNLNYNEEYPWRVSQPHLPLFNRISRVLAWHASAQLALQNSSAAADDVALMLALARDIGGEPFASSMFSRNVILADARQIIWEGLADRRWQESQLSDFEARLQQFTMADFGPQLALERAAINSYFEMVHRDSRIARGWNFGSGLGQKARGFTLRHMPTGWMYLEQVSYHRLFDAVVVPAFDPAGSAQPLQIERAADSGFPLWGHRLLAGPVLKSAGFLLTQAAFTQTGMNQAAIACALERYRLEHQQFPERLEELVPQFLAGVPGDLITGKPLKYRRTEGGQFLLYSVGRNETDEGGKLVLDPQTKAPDPNQGDWVWPPSQ